MLDLRHASIRSRLLGWFLVFALLPLGVLALLNASRTARSVEEEVRIHLVALADQKAVYIERYAVERQRDVTVLSREPRVVEAMARITDVVQQKGLRSREYEVVDAQIRPYFETLVEVSGYTDLFLISPEGEAVFSVKRGEDLGSSYVTGPYRDSELARVFEDARTLLATEISDFDFYPATNEPAAFIGAPIMRDGAVAGVVALQMDNEEAYRVVQDTTGVGVTGETIVAGLRGNQAVVMTPLRHDPDAAFRRRILMGGSEEVLIQKAVQGLATDGHYTDYRGRRVYAVTRYLPSLRWGMVIKMDKDEAFERLFRERRYLAALAGAMLALVALASIAASRSISSPIVALTAVVRRVTGGSLGETVAVWGRDEISELNGAFNRMTTDLKNLYATLEERVVQRTRELARTNALVSVLQRVAAAANEASTTMEEALRIGLDEVCGYTGWPVGHVYVRLPMSSPDLTSSRVWHLDDPDRYRAFVVASEAISLPRAVGLPGRVWESGQAAWIDDVTNDPNFPRAKLAREVDIRAGFAFPITIGAEVVGVMEFFSTDRAPPDHDLLHAMTNIGTQFGRVFERNARLAAETLARQRLEHEFHLARTIQLALLPSAPPVVPGYEIHGGNVPSREVSGDFYTFSLRSEGGECAIFVADVSGKGLGAALLTASLEALLAVPLSSDDAPDAVCNLVSTLLFQRTPLEKYATAFLGVLDLASGRLRYVNAGHNAALLLRADGESEWLPASGLPIGLFADARYTAVETEIRQGDVLVVYTDGITEAMNPRQEEFGEERLLAASRANRHLSPRNLALALEREVDLFAQGQPYADDRTLVVLGRARDAGPAYGARHTGTPAA